MDFTGEDTLYQVQWKVREIWPGESKEVVVHYGAEGETYQENPDWEGDKKKQNPGLSAELIGNNLKHLNKYSIVY